MGTSNISDKIFTLSLLPFLVKVIYVASKNNILKKSLKGADQAEQVFIQLDQLLLKIKFELHLKSDFP